MANGKQARARKVKMAERAKQLKDVHFPQLTGCCIWHRSTNDGYSTIPRTLPLAMQAIDDATKGTPPSPTLVMLWARAPDHPLLTIEHPATWAAEAGYTGERLVDTWRKRMRVLRNLGFITSAPGPTGDFHWVLLMNPNFAIEGMRRKGLVQDALYGRFIDRMAEIGATGELEEIRESFDSHSEKAAAAAEVQTLKEDD